MDGITLCSVAQGGSTSVGPLQTALDLPSWETPMSPRWEAGGGSLGNTRESHNFPRL